MNGAATNPDAHVFACAGAALRKGLEIAHKLGAENYVFWGGREGFQTLLNTDLNKELQNMANFFKMAVGELCRGECWADVGLRGYASDA